MLVEDPTVPDDYSSGELIEVVISTSSTPPEGTVGVFTGWKKYCFDREDLVTGSEWVCVCLIDGDEYHLFREDIQKVENE